MSDTKPQEIIVCSCQASMNLPNSKTWCVCKVKSVGRLCSMCKTNLHTWEIDPIKER